MMLGARTACWSGGDGVNVDFIPWLTWKGLSECYFDTTINASSSLSFELKVFSTSDYNNLFFGNKWDANAFLLIWNYGFKWHNGGNSKTVSVASRTEYEIKCGIGYIEVNGQRSTFSSSGNVGSGTIRLFRIPTSIAGPASGGYGYFKIYDNGTLIKDFRPAKDTNGIVSYYEMISKTYNYANAGSLIEYNPPS